MTTTTAAPATVSTALTTPRLSALRQLPLLLRWQARRMASALPLLVLVQILLSVATVIGYGLLVGQPAPAEALYLATGAPTVSLVMVGLVMTPQLVVQSRTEGSADWMRTLPVPRELFLAADLLVWTLIALPGVVLGVLAGVLRFHVHLAPTWWLLPTALVVSLTAAAVGYAMAWLLPGPIAQLMSQVLVFVVLLFSPVSFPADRMPVWLQHAHHWLPIQPMAEAVRAGLAPGSFTVPGRSVAVMLTWCVVCVAGAAFALRRRA